MRDEEALHDVPEAPTEARPDWDREAEAIVAAVLGPTAEAADDDEAAQLALWSGGATRSTKATAAPKAGKRRRKSVAPAAEGVAGEPATPGTCRKCGCTDEAACVGAAGLGCWWVDDAHTVCSHCVVDVALGMCADDLERIRSVSGLADEEVFRRLRDRLPWLHQVEESALTEIRGHLRSLLSLEAGVIDKVEAISHALRLPRGEALRRLLAHRQGISERLWSVILVLNRALDPDGTEDDVVDDTTLARDQLAELIEELSGKHAPKLLAPVWSSRGRELVSAAEMALRYLEHPDVVRMNFAVPSESAAVRLRTALEELQRVQAVPATEGES